MVLKPKSVFEFGCNNGKNLAVIQLTFPKVVTYGIDIAADNLKNPLTTVGDEITLANMDTKSFDVSFTCSVLNHIPEANWKEIFYGLKRVSKMGVVVCECSHESKDRWFIHNYAEVGLVKTGSVKSLERTYDIWI